MQIDHNRRVKEDNKGLAPGAESTPVEGQYQLSEFDFSNGTLKVTSPLNLIHPYLYQCCVPPPGLTSPPSPSRLLHHRVNLSLRGASVTVVSSGLLGVRGALRIRDSLRNRLSSPPTHRILWYNCGHEGRRMEILSGEWLKLSILSFQGCITWHSFPIQIYRRPDPKSASDIGSWHSIIKVLFPFSSHHRTRPH